MISKIIVKNNIRVGKFIGRLVNYDEDLLLNTSIEVKNFIRKNFDYLKQKIRRQLKQQAGKSARPRRSKAGC